MSTRALDYIGFFLLVSIDWQYSSWCFNSDQSYSRWLDKDKIKSLEVFKCSYEALSLRGSMKIVLILFWTNAYIYCTSGSSRDWHKLKALIQVFGTFFIQNLYFIWYLKGVIFLMHYLFILCTRIIQKNVGYSSLSSS